MVSNPGKFASIPCADRNLLEDQAIHSNPGVGVDHDAIWMRDEKAAADIAVKRNIGSSDDAPKAMTNDEPLQKKAGCKTLFLLQALVASNGQQQLSTGIPKLLWRFPRPIGDLFGRAFVQFA
jgi:hypothetical protein